MFAEGHPIHSQAAVAEADDLEWQNFLFAGMNYYVEVAEKEVLLTATRSTAGGGPDRVQVALVESLRSQRWAAHMDLVADTVQWS